MTTVQVAWEGTKKKGLLRGAQQGSGDSGSIWHNSNAARYYGAPVHI
jgi:hypothetical protein